MPVGNMIPDGFAAKYSFALNPNIALFMKEPTPPSYKGGGKIDLTTMENLLWRTAKPKKLKTVSGAQVIVGYDPVILNTLKTMMLKNDFITLLYGDLSKHQFWGWLEEFNPTSLKEGDFPLATAVIETSNLDNSVPNVEVGPTYVAPP